LDRLTSLATFVRAAEARSFTKAGQQLGLSSSAIGKTIARLEERLNVRLFHRSTRSIMLTDEGRVFLESCRQIIAEMTAVEQALMQTKGAAKGRLRVSLPLVGEYLMPTLSQFMRAFPEIEIEMDFSDQLVDVVSGGFDVVVRIGDVVDSRLMSRTLGTYRLAIVGAPAYFARAGVPVVPADLARHACLRYRSAATGKLERWPFELVATDNDLDVPTAVRASALAPLIALASLGQGIACVPDFAIRRQIEDGSLVRILQDHIDQSEPVRAMWPSSRFMAPKLRVFINFLADRPLSPLEIAAPPPRLLPRSHERERRLSNAPELRRAV
jgi:DNA-binding transcriptional LysR family regulator